MYTIHVAKHHPLVAVYFFAITPGWKQQKTKENKNINNNKMVVLFYFRSDF